MATPHKTKPEQWARLEMRQLGGNDLVCAALELRDRLATVEQRIQNLEAVPEQSSSVATPDHLRDTPEMVATDAELLKAWDVRIDQGILGRIRAIYNLGRQHGATNPSTTFTNFNYPELSDSSSSELIKKVAKAIGVISTDQAAACAAIQVVADWLAQRNPAAIGWAEIIREESERHG